MDIATGQSTVTLWDSACRLHGERPFLVYLDKCEQRTQFSYADFNGMIHRAAHAFRSVGIGPGDPVIVQLRNCPEVLTSMFGLAELGAVSVPVNTDLSRSELLQTYSACGARWAVVEENQVEDHLALWDAGSVALAGIMSVAQPTAASSQASTPEPTAMDQEAGAVADELADGVHNFARLCAAQPDTPVQDTNIGPDALAELLYTSGTTAAPKGVMITHGNLVFSGHYGVWQTSLRPDDRVFTTMPACHSNFQLAALTPVLVAGATLVMAERYSASKFWRQVREERATIVQLIAMMARTLLAQPSSPEDGRHELRDALYFMPISNEEKEEFERRFAVTLLNSYGSTESIAWSVTDPPQGERRWPSVGRPGLGYEVGIFNALGQELPTGEVGEIRIKGVPGRSLMLGYLGDPDATAAALSPDGWLRTNDQGYADKDGWIFFVDRSVNLIKRAGANISTTEVECVLASHPLIAEAAVVGVPDPIRDQAVKAFVRLQAGAQLTPDEVIVHCRELLAPFKVPEYVEFVDDFPRTRSLKIEKRLLVTPTRTAAETEGN